MCVAQAQFADRLRQSDFRRLAAFIQDYAGIRMPPSKITMLEGRLRNRVRATGCGSLTEYCAMLFERDGLRGEAVALIDAVTTNKTAFFREPKHFRILVQQVVPAMLRERPVGDGDGLKLWSAACSTGAEPYTLAMVLLDWCERQRGMRLSILGTDLSTDVLATAQRGIYPEAIAEEVPAEFRRRFLLRSRDRARGLVRVAPELRACVSFRRLNLMDAEYPVNRDMDAIFCRNVLIYFEKPTQSAVLLRLCRHLRPGGFLFLGHSEALADPSLPLRAVGSTVFRRG